MALRFKNRKFFDQALVEFGTKIVPSSALNFQKKIAIELFSRIIEKTPVGNPDLWQGAAPPGYVGGRARANWQISIGSPGSDDTKAPESGVSTGAGISGGQLASGLAGMAGAKPFGNIFIYNNVRYITALENGHSGQAPSGMVGLSLFEIASGLGSL